MEEKQKTFRIMKETLTIIEVKASSFEEATAIANANPISGTVISETCEVYQS